MIPQNRPMFSSCPRTNKNQSVVKNVDPTHNLNINTYTLDELLNIFDLSYKITLDDMKRAKKKVLQLHPDKSNLPSEYFLFYKKAFEIVYNFYENQNKQSVKVEPKKYNASNSSDELFNQVNSAIHDLGEREFQSKFNELFEKNMAKKPDTGKNEWFSKDDPIFSIDQKVNTKNMGEVFETIKQQNQGIIKYSGVQTLYANGQPGHGSGLYDDESTEEYVTCDPFSKLKYDDLRKVHKDQTIFSISESDYSKVTKYNSVDQYNRARSENAGVPMDEKHAIAMLSNEERNMHEKMMEKQFQANLKTMEYEKKNKDIMASFLYIANGSTKK
jgi:hypothetical protein